MKYRPGFTLIWLALCIHLSQAVPFSRSSRSKRNSGQMTSYLGFANFRTSPPNHRRAYSRSRIAPMSHRAGRFAQGTPSLSSRRLKSALQVSNFKSGPASPWPNVSPNRSRSRSPSFLNPANFRQQSMSAVQLQRTLDEIERHIRPKGNNPVDYTGSRMLILLLRDECNRLLQSGDPNIQTFCLQFNARFRSFFF